MTFEKTDLGRRAIQKREVKLSPCQRAVLITVNGSQTRADLERSAAAMGGGASDVDTLIDLALIVVNSDIDLDEMVLPAPPSVSLSVPPSTSPHVPITVSDRPSEMSTTGAPIPVASMPAQGRSISMESLWPESVASVAEEWDPSEGFAEAADGRAHTDVPTVKAMTLQLLQPLGLRAVQLRRAVEAATTSEQLRGFEPMIRELLPEDQRMQLDSAFFGLE